MPALTFLAMVGLVLVASLFFSDAALEKLAQATAANDRYGSIQAVVAAPDMKSQAILAAQPKDPPALDVLAKIEPAARAARAEASPTKKRVTHTQPPVEYRQNKASSHREFGLSGMN
jgi:hypothetical protein